MSINFFIFPLEWSSEGKQTISRKILTETDLEQQQQLIERKKEKLSKRAVLFNRFFEAKKNTEHKSGTKTFKTQVL
jgi:hypothetical protein